MHYYIQGSRTGNGPCFSDFEDAQASLIRLIVAKLENASTDQIRIAARCIGEVADWVAWSYSEVDAVNVGSDTWRILTCENYSCDDESSGDW